MDARVTRLRPGQPDRARLTAERVEPAASAARPALARRTASRMLRSQRRPGDAGARRRRGTRPGRPSDGSSATASPAATSCSSTARSLERWRRSGSKPPSARHARTIESSNAVPERGDAQTAPASAASGTVSGSAAASACAAGRTMTSGSRQISRITIDGSRERGA